MNKKIALMVCLMTIFGMKLSAQNESHYGFYLGMGINNMSIDNRLYYDDSQVNTTYSIIEGDTTYMARYLPIDDAKVSPNARFVIGGFYEYEISKVLGLQFHLLYNEYGYKISGTIDQKDIADDNINTYKYKANTKMSNISAALLLKINVIKKDLSVELGFQPSYCFRMIKETEYSIIHKSNVYESNKEYNPLNVCSSIGLTYNMLDNLFVSMRLNIGFIDVLKSKEPFITKDDPYTIKYTYDDVKSTTNSLLLTVGYKFK